MLPQNRKRAASPSLREGRRNTRPTWGEDTAQRAARASPTPAAAQPTLERWLAPPPVAVGKPIAGPVAEPPGPAARTPAEQVVDAQIVDALAAAVVRHPTVQLTAEVLPDGSANVTARAVPAAITFGSPHVHAPDGGCCGAPEAEDDDDDDDDGGSKDEDEDEDETPEAIMQLPLAPKSARDSVAKVAYRRLVKGAWRKVRNRGRKYRACCTRRGCIMNAQGATDYCKGHGGGTRCTHVDDETGAPCPRSARDATDYCSAHGGGTRCAHVDDETETPCRHGAEGTTEYCSAHGGGKRCAHVDDETDAPCRHGARGATDYCRGHGGGKRCAHVDDETDAPCRHGAVDATDYCKGHGGGKRCAHVDDETDAPCPRSAKDATDYCIGHGGGRLCAHVDDETGAPCRHEAKGATDYCKGHGGGKRCECGASASYEDADGNKAALCRSCAIAEGTHPERVAGASYEACRFFCLLSRMTNKREDVPHVHWDRVSGEWNGYEEVEGIVPGRKIRPDGFLPDASGATKGTAYLHHGNRWHGYPPGHPEHGGEQVFRSARTGAETRVKNADLYAKTEANTQAYLAAGYGVVEMWGHDFKEVERSNGLLQSLLVRRAP